MRDDTHGYTGAYGCPVRPVGPFEVIERIRDNDGVGRRTDTLTRSLRYALERRDWLRRTNRPAFVREITGRRVERAW